MSNSGTQKLLAAIAALGDRPMTLMEVCGTHTMAIAKSGLRQVLPQHIKLVSGPGCPVCVTPAAAMDQVLELSSRPEVTLTTYGDLMRVPGSVRGDDLRRRIDNIVVGFTAENEAVYAKEFGVTDSMLAILKEAINPNLVQSLEGVPAFVHGGPFANIAHGCNSVIATKMALTCADYAVTEAGFAFDLGAEKFLDIKCRQSGLAPDAIVIVATIRALKMHGGVDKKQLDPPNVEAVKRGLANLQAHIESAKLYKRPVTVAINLFEAFDTEEEIAAVKELCASMGVGCAVANVFGKGGEGAQELARVVTESMEKADNPPFECLYGLDIPVVERMATIARNIYGADGVVLTPSAKKKLALMEANGLTDLPVCMAKTQNSLSDNANLPGRPTGFTITVRDFEIANGAGFLVALCGDIMRMPGLPKVPSACDIKVDSDGNITGMKG